MYKEKVLKIMSGEDVSTTKNEMFSIIRDCKHENEVLQDVNERYIKRIKELEEKNEKLGEELVSSQQENLELLETLRKTRKTWREVEKDLKETELENTKLWERVSRLEKIIIEKEIEELVRKTGLYSL